VSPLAVTTPADMQVTNVIRPEIRRPTSPLVSPRTGESFLWRMPGETNPTPRGNVSGSRGSPAALVAPASSHFPPNAASGASGTSTRSLAQRAGSLVLPVSKLHPRFHGDEPSGEPSPILGPRSPREDPMVKDAMEMYRNAAAAGLGQSTRACAKCGVTETPKWRKDKSNPLSQL
jgi:hypothetical protein